MGIAAFLRDDQKALLAAQGALDGNQVWCRFSTMHDMRVRPSHAALDGTVWRSDDPAAPTPPLSWGCRCFLTYVARPNTSASAVFPTAETEPAPLATVYEQYLDRAMPEWSKAVEAVAEVPVEKKTAALYLQLRRSSSLPSGDLRDIIRMILTIVVSRRV